MNVESFEKLHGFFIEDLKVGQKAILKKKITENDINQFSLVTGDNNPVHINEKKRRQFYFPGPRSLENRQNFSIR